MNTQISYLYRDASNYKQHNKVTLAGEITDAEKRLILGKLEEGEYFIPSQVGLDDLQPRMIGFPDAQDDHVWHELREDDFELVDGGPTVGVEMDIHQFAKKFDGIEWDVCGACDRLGLEQS